MEGGPLCKDVKVSLSACLEAAAGALPAQRGGPGPPEQRSPQSPSPSGRPRSHPLAGASTCAVRSLLGHLPRERHCAPEPAANPLTAPALSFLIRSHGHQPVGSGGRRA